MIQGDWGLEADALYSLLPMRTAMEGGRGANETLFLIELYSYTEGPEFLMNRKCFEEDFRIHGEPVPCTCWFLCPCVVRAAEFLLVI